MAQTLPPHNEIRQLLMRLARSRGSKVVLLYTTMTEAISEPIWLEAYHTLNNLSPIDKLSLILFWNLTGANLMPLTK